MSGVARVTVIGRSLRTVAAVWGGLRSFYTSADLIVAEEPVGRALEESSRDETAVFVIAEEMDDFEALARLDEEPEWLVVLCPPELLQRMQPRLDEPATNVPVLSLEDVHLALLGRQVLSLSPRQSPHRERL
jgi:hypothetical protein